MKQPLLIFISLFSFSSFSFSQSLSPNLISAAGGISKTENLSLEWTLGESAIETNTTSHQIFTEGFHQSNLRIISNYPNDANNNLGSKYDITVAPNPVNSKLSVKIQSNEDSKLNFFITDMEGKKQTVLESESIDSKNIDMSLFAPGIYLLNINKENGELIKTYKILKIQ